MDNSISKKLTIGEFASVCGTTVQKLRVYDRKGVLRPAHVGDQGYRYYDPLQIYVFHTIAYLKRCGRSLREIKDYLHCNAIDSRQEKQYKRDIEELERRIDELRSSVRQIKATEYFFKKFFSGNYGVEPVIFNLSRPLKCPATHISPNAATDSAEFSIALARHIEKHRCDPVYPIYPMALVVAEKGTTCKRLMVSNVLCMPYPEESGDTCAELYTMPAGRYVLTRYNGPSRVPVKSMIKLHRFIRKNSLHVCGDSIAIIAVSGVSEENETLYACAIMIPVE